VKRYELIINLPDDANAGVLRDSLDAAIASIEDAYRNGTLENVSVETAELRWSIKDRPSLHDRATTMIEKASAKVTPDVPILNAIGPAAAEERPQLNAAIRGQLKLIHDQTEHYLSDPDQMPHEWGSIDSFDDMRNSLFVGVELMDHLMYGPDEDVTVFIRRTIADRGMCASAQEVWNAAFPGGPEEHDQQEDLLFAMLQSGEYADPKE
jgi:hypothetical protein